MTIVVIIITIIIIIIIIIINLIYITLRFGNTNTVMVSDPSKQSLASSNSFVIHHSAGVSQLF